MSQRVRCAPSWAPDTTFFAQALWKSHFLTFHKIKRTKRRFQMRSKGAASFGSRRVAGAQVKLCDVKAGQREAFKIFWWTETWGGINILFKKEWAPELKCHTCTFKPARISVFLLVQWRPLPVRTITPTPWFLGCTLTWFIDVQESTKNTNHL